MREEQGKIILDKRPINNLIYELLEAEDNEGEKILDKIVRHYKIISKDNNAFDVNDNSIKLELSQKVDNYENVVYGSRDYTTNTSLNNIIDFGYFHNTINEIKEIINNAKQSAYISYVSIIKASDFSNNEKNQINEAVQNYLNNNKNDIYIRLGLDPSEKNEYLIKLFEIYIPEYFNDLSGEAQNNLLNSEQLLPMYNDTIFYALNKYNFIKQQEAKILEFNENNN